MLSLTARSAHAARRFNVPTGMMYLVVGVRWFDSSGEACGGTPLAQPADRPDLVYSVINDKWVKQDELSDITPAAIASSKPFALFQLRHYR